MTNRNKRIAVADLRPRFRDGMTIMFGGFLGTGTPDSMVRELLELAACAPSGTNIQPWRVYALSGKDKEALSQAILAKHEKGESDGEQAGVTPQAPATR